MKCRICGTEKLEKEELSDVLVDVNSVFVEPTVLPKMNIDFYWCPICRHGQIHNNLEVDHYKNYNLLNIGKKNVEGGGNTKSRAGYYAEVIQRMSEISYDRRRILDIGCGHGTLLKLSEDYFEEGLGIEPSDVECGIAQKQGLHVINGLFDEEFEEKDFSAFLSTQVWEHFADPVGAINKAYEVLKPGGVGYIDVPNGQAVYGKGEYYNVYVEHINYFSTVSLGRLCSGAGFEILSLGEILDGSHIAVMVRKPLKRESFGSRKKRDRKRLLEYLTQFKAVSIWGAGIKGRAYAQNLRDMDTHSLRYIFDKNAALRECYMDGCEIRIEDPSADKILENDAILISATEYKKEIIRELREKYHYEGVITCIDE